MINCNSIPFKDKGCHFIAGVIISIAGILLTGIAWVGLLAGLIVGVAKEIYDEYQYGGADFFDFFATVAGTFAGVVLYAIVR